LKSLLEKLDQRLNRLIMRFQTLEYQV
jgi:hypothetical protein